ncbi:ROK family transcriptional regulator [Phytoactinopolyspora endophytica]|uniref:ROK family transcriptional regulator n=1 Tax=Phytoactinopolyspora endophytica TaxID=1642495 RepID=UPI00101B8909|nr:ROK family transcriptional regulator [Phytoactinopolyspora endophytica]
MSDPRRPGSLPALKLANRRRLLAVLQDGRAISQAELARLTGLAPATISSLVRTLSAEGELVVSEGIANGRRSRLVELSPQRRRYGIGIDLGRTHVRVVVGTEIGDVLAEATAALPDRHHADVAMDAITSLVDAVREQAGLEADQIMVVAMGVPAPVDAATGAVTEAAILPPWVGFPLRERLHDALGRPVVVENDADLGAIALARQTGIDDSLVFVKVASGIGAGVAINGQLLRGHSGAVGEIGHLALDPGLSMVCRCGRRGCLETVSSAESIRIALSSALDSDLELADVVRLVREGNPVAVRILDEAGEMLGRGLGWLAMIVNPAEIALGGPLLAVGDAWLRPVREGFRRAVLPGVAAQTRLTLSPLGERTVAVGALVASLREQIVMS